jgi:hypothetical protein
LVCFLLESSLPYEKSRETKIVRETKSQFFYIFITYITKRSQTMPSIIPLQRFTDHAATLDNQAAIFARGHGNDRAPSADNGVRGLRRFFSSANTKANQHAVKAFWRSVKDHPACATIRGELKSLLRERWRTGAPLTAGVVRQVQTRLNAASAQMAHFGQARELGSQLATSRALPAGHGTDFALHVTARNLPLGTDGEKKAALKSYLLDKMCQPGSPFFAKLTEIPGQGNRGPLLSKALQKLCDPLGGPDGFFAQQLDTMLEGGVEAFSLDAFKTSFQRANADKLDQLQHLGPKALEILGRPDSNSTGASNLLALLAEAQPTVGDGNLDKLAQFVIATQSPVDSPEARAVCLRGFFQEEAVGGLGNGLARRGLPENLASALGHHPEVVRRIDARLAEELGKPGAPTEGQALRDLVKTCVEETVDTFVTEHEAELQDLVTLSQNPPVDVDPPLSPDTLPRYLNALLSSDALIAPLLDNDAPIDGSLDRLNAFNDSVVSTKHSARGDFGPDDIIKMRESVLALSLARRGVDESRYGEMMTRALARLAPLYKELISLAKTVDNARVAERSGDLGDPVSNQAATLKCMETSDLLMSVVIDFAQKIPHEQKIALGIVSHGTPAPVPGDRRAQESINDQVFGFVSRHFMQRKAIPLEELSAGTREWATGLGLRLPPASGASAQRAENALLEGNRGALNLFMDAGKGNDLFPKAKENMAREAASPAFRSVFAQAAQAGDLTDIEPDRLQPRDFLVATRNDLESAVRGASAEGRTLDAESLNAIAERSLSRQFGELKVLHDTLGALPEPAAGQPPKAGEFTAAEKALMQEMAQRHGLRDEKALTALLVQARQGQAQMSALAGQSPSADLLAKGFKELSSAYLNAQTAIGEQKPVGNDDAPTVFCEMSMRLAGLSNTQEESVRENLSSPLAETVAGAFLLACEDAISSDQLRLTIAVRLMSYTRTVAEVQSQGNSVESSGMLPYDPLEHPSEIPGGSHGCMEVVASMAPSAFSATDVALAERVPPFSSADWDALRTIADRAARSGGDYTTRWISAAGPELLAKQRAVGRDLSLGEIWSIVTGDRRMPRGVTEANFGTRLHDYTKGIASGIVRALRPDADPYEASVAAETLMDTCGRRHISPKQMKVLAKPNAVLTLSDVHTDLSMRDLNRTPLSTAYGLVTDYRRHFSHTMRLDPGDGSGMDFSSIPIPPEENKPDNPIFQHIIENVRNMCGGNEAQTARVLQAFSQVPLVAISNLTVPFTANTAIPHYPVTVTATRLPSGQVRVDIKSKDNAPLEFNVQYTIETNGSYACTDFNMKRR